MKHNKLIFEVPKAAEAMSRATPLFVGSGGGVGAAGGPGGTSRGRSGGGGGGGPSGPGASELGKELRNISVWHVE